MTLDYKHANQILTNKSNNTLWLGDCQAAQNIQFLRKNNIRVVVTAAAGFDNIKYDASVRHYRYPLQDIKTENMFPYFDQVVQKIRQGLRWGSVLVHCGAGVSRSAALVIAYLIKYKKMSFMEALNFAKSKRPQVCPNLGFQLQLKKYATQPSVKSFNILGTTTTQNFYMPIELNTKSSFNHSIDSVNSKQLPHVWNRVKIPAIQNTNLIQKQRLTQPKGWRISYALKPQFQGSSLDAKNQTQLYIKKLANFRFGQTNAFKWGLQ